MRRIERDRQTTSPPFTQLPIAIAPKYGVCTVHGRKTIEMFDFFGGCCQLKVGYCGQEDLVLEYSAAAAAANIWTSLLMAKKLHFFPPSVRESYIIKTLSLSLFLLSLPL